MDDLISSSIIPNLNIEHFHLPSYGSHVGLLSTKEFWFFCLNFDSFVWNTSMAAIPIVFCVSWDCVKILYSFYFALWKIFAIMFVI